MKTKIRMEIEVDGTPEEWQEFLKQNLLSFGVDGVACLIEGKERWFVNDTHVQVVDDANVLNVQKDETL